MSASETGSETDATTLGTSSSTTAGSGSTEPSECGDGEVQGGEQCDDGNDENNDACPNTCELPVCGDGYVAPDEECDDGNGDDDDGCNNVCARDRVVFVSSVSNKGALTGVDGAINRCRQRALEAGLENPMDFRPWIGSAEFSPAIHFVKSSGRYVLTNGVKVADDWNDLIDGELDAPIDVDENGDELGGVSVWTNTLPNGTPHPEMAHCEEWTNSGLAPGFRGRSTYTDDRWTIFADPAPCGTPGHLYCFEQ